MCAEAASSLFYRFIVQARVANGGAGRAKAFFALPSSRPQYLAARPDPALVRRRPQQAEAPAGKAQEEDMTASGMKLCPAFPRAPADRADPATGKTKPLARHHT